MKRQLELFREVCDKARVFLRIFTANPMLQVRDFELQVKLPLKLAEKVE